MGTASQKGDFGNQCETLCFSNPPVSFFGLVTFVTNVPGNSHTPVVLALTPPPQDQMEIDHDSQYRVTPDYEDRE
jgi:hypothetical protein